jgi:predicted nucleic acid-binding protein
MIDQNQAMSLARLAIRLKPGIVEVGEEESEEAMVLSKRTKLTFYDSIYVVLSKFRKIPLITSDDNQLELAQDHTTSIHLGDIDKLLRTSRK